MNVGTCCDQTHLNNQISLITDQELCSLFNLRPYVTHGTRSIDDDTGVSDAPLLRNSARASEERGSVDVTLS